MEKQEKNEEGSILAEQPLIMPKSIRLYRWGNIIKCNINGTTYFTPEAYLRGLAFKTRYFVYLTRWHTEEEHKEWLKQKAIKEQEEEKKFKEKVKISLRRKDKSSKQEG